MSILPLAFALTCTLLIFLSIRIFRRNALFRAFLKISFAIPVLSLCFVLMLVAWDLLSYRAQHHSEKIAGLHVRSLGVQTFELSLHVADELPVSFEVNGDLWQIDLRLLVWSGFWSYLGLDSLYKFERLSGRYHAIKDELSRPRSLYDLSFYDSVSRDLQVQEELPFEPFSRFHLWLSAYTWLPGVEAVYGSGTYLPMEDGAEYSLYLYSKGVQARAENDLARSAIRQWQAVN